MFFPIRRRERLPRRSGTGNALPADMHVQPLAPRRLTPERPDRDPVTLLVAVFVVMTTLLASPPAGWAQTMPGSGTAITAVGSPIRIGTSRTASVTAMNQTASNVGINRADCFDPNQYYKFILNLPSMAPSGGTAAISLTSLEVWASTSMSGCSTLANRSVSNPAGTVTTNTSATCFRVASLASQQVVNGKEIHITPIQIVRAIQQHVNDDDTSISHDPATVCNAPDEQPGIVWLQFIPFGGDGLPLGGNASTGYEYDFSTSWDIAGPVGPTDLSVQAGNTLLIANYTPLSGVQNLLKYQAYCVPDGVVFADGGAIAPTGKSLAPASFADPTVLSVKDIDSATLDGDASDVSTADAVADGAEASATTTTSSGGTTTGGTTSGGTTTTGGTTSSGGTTTSGGMSDAVTEAGDAASGSGGFTNCTISLPTNFAPGNIPDPSYDQFIHGANSGTVSGQITAKGLTNDKVYAVAVAAIDSYGNPGTLSNVYCLAPRQTVDFYDAYRAKNGQGGGGFCTIVQRSVPAQIGVGGGLLAVAALALRRSRRRSGYRGKR